MKTFRTILGMLMISVCTSLLGQTKGEMPFTTSSPEAQKLVRQAWVAYADVNLEEGNKLAGQALEKDPSCGMAVISLFEPDQARRNMNFEKAQGMKLSPDEKLFLDGIIARTENKPTQEYFDPLLKKYPKDSYLQILIIYNTEPKGRLVILEALNKRDPKFAPAYNLLGYAYMDQNEMSKAAASFDKYVSLRPELGNVYDSKGDYMMRTENFKEAVSLYEKAVSLGYASSAVKAQRAAGRVQNPTITEKDKENIKMAINASTEELLKGNVDGALRFYSDQAVGIYANQMVNVGAPNIRQLLSNNLKGGSYTKLVSSVESVEGLGPIAVVQGTREAAFKPTEGQTDEVKRNFVHLIRKQADGSWKLFVTHFYEPSPSGDEEANVRKVLSNWSGFVKTGETVTEKNIEAFAANYSPQAIEIFPSLITNVGLTNMRLRWSGFEGSKWETNSIGTLGVKVAGRRAAAWGMLVQNYYPKGSEKLIKSQFPWVMVLTKEKDDVWRVLAIHWGAQ